MRCDSETQFSESPSASSFSSPLAAPLSTSTPVEHWPTGKGEADAEEAPLLLRAVSSLTPAANVDSSASGSPCEQLPTPAWKGTEESSGDKARETGTGKEARSDESEKTLMGQHEELVKMPFPEQHWAPSPHEAPGAPSVLSISGGRVISLAERSPTESGSSVENVHDDGMTTAVEEAMPPLQEEEAPSSFHHIAQKHEGMHQNASGGPKKAKKRVSFSEQLFVEEEAEGSTELEEEDKSHPQQLTQEGPVAGHMPHAGSPESPHREGTGQEPVTTEAQPAIPSESKSLSEGPTSEASPARGTQLLRDAEKDDLMAPCQSKASDHEGLLSNPLSDLPSASDMKSPIMADLSLSLPSIPEVASDDERVDEAGDGGKTERLVDLEAGVPPLNGTPSILEMAEEASGGAHESEPVENQCDFRPQTPSSVNEELPGPGTVEEEKLMGSGKPGPPLCISQDSPVPSSSLAETFPTAAHSFPRSPSSDSHHTSVAESQKQATADVSASKVENLGKKKPILQAWVTPSEIHPAPAQPSAGAGAAKHR